MRAKSLTKHFLNELTLSFCNVENNTSHSHVDGHSGLQIKIIELNTRWVHMDLVDHLAVNKNTTTTINHLIVSILC